jgi:hypothetical protein
MEIFFEITDKVEFVKRLLDIAQNKEYIIVLEFENERFCELDKFRFHCIEKALPKSARHCYDKDYFLKAFEVIREVDFYIVAYLFAYVSVMTVYKNETMVCMIADDFHDDCFSCSKEFYKQYKEILKMS